MHPQLMGAAGDQLQFQQGPVLSLFEQAIAGESWLAGWVNCPQLGMAGVPADRCCDISCCCRRLAQNQSLVESAQLALSQQLIQPVMTMAVAGKQHDAAGIPIQPVNRMGNRGLALLLKVIGYALGQSRLLSRLRTAGMNGYPGWFIDGKAEIIFKENIQLHRHGRESGGRGAGFQQQFELVACFDLASQVGRVAIEQYAPAAGEALDGPAGDLQLLAQHCFYSQTGLFGGNGIAKPLVQGFFSFLCYNG